MFLCVWYIINENCVHTNRHNMAISYWDRDREITTKRELFHGLEWADGRVMHLVSCHRDASRQEEREDVELPWKTTETIVITMLCYTLPAAEFQVVLFQCHKSSLAIFSGPHTCLQFYKMIWYFSNNNITFHWNVITEMKFQMDRII